jgi:hypothetical protein
MWELVYGMFITVSSLYCTVISDPMNKIDYADCG